MIDLLHTIGLLSIKLIITLVVIYCLILVYYHFRAISRLNFYEKQKGVTPFPGNRRFIFGNNIDLIDYGKVRAKELVCGPHQWLYSAHFPNVMNLPESQNGEDRFKANEYPVLACNFMTQNALWVSDPEIV